MTLRRVNGSTAILVLGLAAAVPAWGASARVYVTNSAGDNVHVIDPATNKVVQVIKGVEAVHGVGFSPDGKRVYLSNEADATLDVVDQPAMLELERVGRFRMADVAAPPREGQHRVHGGADAQELRSRLAPRRSGQPRREPAPHAAAGAAAGRFPLSLRRAAVRKPRRSGVEDPGRVGEPQEVTARRKAVRSRKA